jgi:hypothetical protein
MNLHRLGNNEVVNKGKTTHKPLARVPSFWETPGGKPQTRVVCLTIRAIELALFVEVPNFGLGREDVGP